MNSHWIACVGMTGMLLGSLTVTNSRGADMDRETFQMASKGQHKASTVLVVQEGPGKVVLFSANKANRRSITNVGEKPHEIEMAPDGKTAFVSNFGLLEVNHQIGTPGTTISVVDTKHGIELKRFDLPSGSVAPHGLKLRPPKYRELFTNTEVGNEAMVVLDADSGHILRSFGLPRGVHNFIFDSGGSALFALTTNNVIMRIDPDTGKITVSTQVASPRGLAWTADHKSIIVGARNELLFLNPTDLSVTSRFANLGVGQIFYPAATPDGRWILAPAVLDGVVLIVDAKTGTVAHRIETGSPLQAIPDGKRAWISNVLVPPELLEAGATPRMGGVVMLDLETFQVVPVPDIPDANGIAVSAVPLHPD